MTMTTTRSICLCLTLAAASLGCRDKRDHEPEVPGTNRNAARVVEAEDPVTHQPMATEDRPTASNPRNDYSDTPGVAGAHAQTGTPANTAPVASRATAAAAAGPDSSGAPSIDPVDQDKAPMASDAGVPDAAPARPTKGKPGTGSGSGSSSAR